MMDCICHNFYFSRPLRSDWAHWCWEFGERYAETFKLSIDRYDFTPYDHHPGGKNQDEIDDALREDLAAERVMTLVMCSDDSGRDEEGGETFSFSVADLRHSHGYGQIYLQVAKSAYPVGQAARDTIRAILDDLTTMFQVDYGFVDQLPANERPRYYYSGIGLRSFSENAERDFLEWDVQAPYFRNLYRSVTWGTWLTPGHWGASVAPDTILADLSATGAQGFIPGTYPGVFIGAAGEIMSSADPAFGAFGERLAAALKTLNIHSMHTYQPSEDTLFAVAPHPVIDRGQTEPEPAPVFEEEMPMIPSDDDGPVTSVMTLEAFFHPAQDESAIGRSLLDHPGLEAFADTFRELRRDKSVSDVVIQISNDDPDDERDLAEWVYITTSHDQDVLEDRLADLQPDVIHQGLPPGAPDGFPPPPTGMEIFAVWWD